MEKQGRTKKSGLKSVHLVLAFLAIYFSASVYYSEFKFQWIYPFVLLFTPFRSLADEAWSKYGSVDKRVVYPPKPIPEIQAKGNFLNFNFAFHFKVIYDFKL
jgi:hypothetical protein